MEDIKLNVSKNISELRQANGMTQIDLAEKLSYSDKAVSKWERGESIPDVTVLVSIANIFGVTLDYLISSDHTEKAPAAAACVVDDEKKKRNRILVTEISMLLAWFVATAVFVILGIVGSSWSIGYHWLSFVYAVPVSAIVWLVFNSVWFDPHANYFIISILVWSLLCSIYLTVLACGPNIWQLFLLGIPGQIIIIICSRFAKKPGDKLITLPKGSPRSQSE